MKTLQVFIAQTAICLITFFSQWAILAMKEGLFSYFYWQIKLPDVERLYEADYMPLLRCFIL